jgi:hypothetical protein
MFNMPTSGPLSPTVSLERRKLEQAGAQPGQEQQAAASMGSPISGDLAQLIQLNRMLQQRGTAQQQANAAPSTVAQDLMQQVTQQRAPQMQPQMPPQMQPQMPPQPDPRQQGIAQLPQEAVGNGMAAGGIVAFENGGNVRHFAGGGLTDQEKAELAKLEMLHTAVLPAYGAGYDAEMAKQQTRARYQELRARQKAAEQEPAQSAGNFNMVQDAQQRRNDEARSAPTNNGQGLRYFVPTLSAPKNEAPPKEELPSEYDMLVNQMRANATKNDTWFEAQRQKKQDAAGLTAIWKKQQEEQERLKAEASPEEERRAFFNKLAADYRDMAGQRGVSRSSRLAQMVGAIGGAKSSTEEAFKKRREELNRAALDLQEKQAMYRATGSDKDAAAAVEAKKEYMTAVRESEADKRMDARNAELARIEQARLNLTRRGQDVQQDIATRDRDARVTNASIAAAARAQMTSAQYSAVYNNAKKAVDASDGMGLARAQVAKAANMGRGRIPAPGVDQKFDGMVNKLYKQMIEEQMAASLPGGRMAGVGMGAPVPVDEE